MTSKRYRKRVGEHAVKRVPRPAKAGWLQRAFPKRLRTLWLYGASFLVVIGLFMQHVIHEGLIDIVAYAASEDASLSAWVEQLRAAGYHVHVKTTSDPDRVRRQLGVPIPLAACHTSVTVQGNYHYVLEGNIPAHSIDNLLANHPEIRGLAAIPEPDSPAERARSVKIVTIDR